MTEAGKSGSDSARMGDSEKSGPNARRAGSNDAATKEAVAAAIKETKWSRAGAAGRFGGADDGGDERAGR